MLNEYQGALETLEEAIEYPKPWPKEWVDALVKLDVLISKQIPLKVQYRNINAKSNFTTTLNLDKYNCTSCGIELFHTSSYCPYCGQRLDWKIE